MENKEKCYETLLGATPSRIEFLPVIVTFKTIARHIFRACAIRVCGLGFAYPQPEKFYHPVWNHG